MAQILRPSGFQPLSCQQLSVMEVSLFYLKSIESMSCEPSTVNQFAIAAAHSQSDNVDFEFSENAASCLLTTSCIQSCSKVDSVLAQQHHRINRQCALSWDPCSQKAQQKHGQHNTGQDQRIARRGCVHDESQNAGGQDSK